MVDVHVGVALRGLEVDVDMGGDISVVARLRDATPHGENIVSKAEPPQCVFICTNNCALNFHLNFEGSYLNFLNTLVEYFHRIQPA